MASAFVPGFKHDVFISYARADDQTTDGSNGWVTTLKLELQRLVNAELDGFKSVDNFYFDEATLPANEAVSEGLAEAVGNSAILLVVLTNAYVASHWCRQERERFIEAAQQTNGAAGRIFVVRMNALKGKLDDDSQYAARPSDLQDVIGIDFYKVDKTLNVPRTFPTNSDDFGKWIDVLRFQLTTQLRSMAEPNDTTEDSDRSPSTEDGDAERDNPAIVYFSEVPGELKDEFATLQTALSKNLDPPIKLVPAKTGLWKGENGYDSTIRSALSESDLFVQLLGCQTFPKRDAFRDGFESWLGELAKELRKPILRWRDAETYPPDELADWVTDEAWRSVLSGADINTQRLSQFQELLITECRRLRQERLTREKLSRARLEPELAAPKFVLVKADKPDLPRARELGQFLLDQQIGIELINGELTLDEAADETIYDAVIVYYGTCDAGWISKQVRAVRNVMVKDFRRVPRRQIVYAPPPVEDKTVNAMLPSMQVVQNPDEDKSRQALLAAVNGEAV